MVRTEAQPTTCPACLAPVGVRDQHYVSGVGHMAHPDDAFPSYYRCLRDSGRQIAPPSPDDNGRTEADRG